MYISSVRVYRCDIDCFFGFEVGCVVGVGGVVGLGCVVGLVGVGRGVGRCG